MRCHLDKKVPRSPTSASSTLSSREIDLDSGPTRRRKTSETPSTAAATSPSPAITASVTTPVHWDLGAPSSSPSSPPSAPSSSQPSSTSSSASSLPDSLSPPSWQRLRRDPSVSQRATEPSPLQDTSSSSPQKAPPVTNCNGKGQTSRSSPIEFAALSCLNPVDPTYKLENPTKLPTCPTRPHPKRLKQSPSGPIRPDWTALMSAHCLLHMALNSRWLDRHIRHARVAAARVH